jgi:DNA polymerase-3 subunit gamma/tau
MVAMFERFRPTRLEDVVGQAEAVSQIQRVLSRGWGGNAFWLSGPSGTGKTTAGRIIASMGADAISIEELDAQRLTPAKVRDIVDSYSHRSLFGNGGKAWIVNECHSMRRDTITELLTALEPLGGLPNHVCWIFTTTTTGEKFLFDRNETGDAAPLLSRCHVIQFHSDERASAAFARRAKEIAMAEGIDGLPLSVYANAVSASGGNMRRVLQRIESGAFKVDAVQAMEREYAMIKTTKGPDAERRRAELQAAIASAKGGV